MTRRPRPYDRTTHDGQAVDWLTKAALLKAERLIARWRTPSYTLSITQGSYNAGRVSASAGTHDGGGVVDLRAWDWPIKVRALRLSGFRAWRRAPHEGPWPDHIHAVLQGNRLLAASAEDQVDDARRGRNGLANNGPDPHEGMPFRPFRWPYYGPIGVVRWHLDHGGMNKAQRRAFRDRIVGRLNITRKDLDR